LSPIDVARWVNVAIQRQSDDFGGEPKRTSGIQWEHDDEGLGETSETVIDLPVNVQENS